MYEIYWSLMLCYLLPLLIALITHSLPWPPLPRSLLHYYVWKALVSDKLSLITLKLAVWERRGCFWQRRLIIRYLKPICEISVLYSAVLIPSLLRENITKSPKWSQITKTRATDIQACGTQAGWAMSTTCGAPTHARKAMSSIVHNVWCPHAG